MSGGNSSTPKTGPIIDLGADQMAEIRRFLLVRMKYALENALDRTNVIPLEAFVLKASLTEYDQKHQRKGTMKLVVPNAVVQALKGPKEHRPLYVVLEIPAEIASLAETGIVLPKVN